MSPKKMTMKKRWQIVSTFVLACLTVMLAVFIAHESSKVENNQIGQRETGRSRAPASIEHVFDYSNLQGTALEYAAKQRLLSSIVVAKDGDDAVVQLGNYVLSNDSQEKDFACGYYDQVTLEFDAEGVAVSGEKPHIVVQAGCEVGDNINSFVPIRIPVSKLKTNAPMESEYQFFQGKTPLKIQMTSPPPQWPGQWVLTDLKLTNSQNPSRILHVEAGDIRSSTGSIKMNW
jgi:hypothetical protein